MTALMVCHNVTPTNDDGDRILQAASPDEIALVKFAEARGYFLEKRTNQEIEVRNPGGFQEKYFIHDCFPFTSERKRMGILVEDLISGKFIFYLKGADTVFKERVSKMDASFISEECENLAKDGLRTLVITQKVLTAEQYREWNEKYKEAGKDFKRRDELEEKCIEELESKVDFQAITGVEDLLQEDIKYCIQQLRDAGIKVWMLTGDKLETAKCIAVATALKSNSQQFFELTDFTDETDFRLRLEQYEKQAKDVLIIEGETLAKVCQISALKDLFLRVSALAPSVICCRCAPTQKAEITTGLKIFLGRGVCAIGDGGNDVGMIQCANVVFPFIQLDSTI